MKSLHYYYHTENVQLAIIVVYLNPEDFVALGSKSSQGEEVVSTQLTVKRLPTWKRK